MKNNFRILPALLAMLIIVIGCNKSNNVIVSPAAFNVINAIPGSNPIIPVFGTQAPIKYFASALSINYPGSSEYSPLSGANTLYIVQSNDTIKINRSSEMFSGRLNLLAGRIYSFFLAGDTSHIDTMLVQDHIPPIYADSSAGVRFVNLATGSNPVSLTISGSPASQTQFSNVAYKGITNWKKYPANNAVPGFYTFTVRDQASGDSLTSCMWYYTLFRNSTLIISGSAAPGSPTPLQVYQMNNF
jgi:hypothetical protein